MKVNLWVSVVTAALVTVMLKRKKQQQPEAQKQALAAALPDDKDKLLDMLFRAHQLEFTDADKQQMEGYAALSIEDLKAAVVEASGQLNVNLKS